jgi:predicted RecB family nuclease
MGDRRTSATVGRAARAKRDLTLLFEMGRGRAAAFEEIGISKREDLDTCDVQSVAADLRAIGTKISPAQIEQMRFHAQSYREGRAILFGSPPAIGDSFFALDLEYDLFKPRVWLIGLYAVDGEEREHVALWADDEPEERSNLESLAALLDERRELPVVTWGGISADLPQLKGACNRLGLERLLDRLDERHVDVFVHARRTLRLPIPELALGEVAAFFGVTKNSSVCNGREAQALYARYLTRYSPRVRRIIKDELITYNRDDLDALVETVRAVQRLPVEGAHTIG